MSSSIPAWWMDIRRSRWDALRSYAEILEKIAHTVDHLKPLRSLSKEERSLTWAALLQAESVASRKLSQSIRLAQARLNDAAIEGLEFPPFDVQLAEETTAVIARSQVIRRKIGEAQHLLAKGFSRRLKRIRQQEIVPTQIDFHL